MRTLLAVLAFAALPVAAMPGYFSTEAPELKPKVQAFSCSIQVRYHADHADRLQIQYLGDAASCNSSFAAAAAAAFTVAPGAPKDGFTAGDPGYECGIDVNFEPAAPQAATVIFTGAGLCNTGHAQALRINRDLNRCGISGIPC